MIVTTSARRTSNRANPDPVVLIRSSAYSSLPSPGTRVTPSDIANMPTIQAPIGAGGIAAIETAAGAHHYRLCGIHFKASTGERTFSVVNVGGQAETVVSDLPTDITIDRCVIQGDSTYGARRGIHLDGIRAAVIDSYIYSIGENGADTQAVWAYNTPGPLKIVNNHLEAAGENLMFGGAEPVISNQLPRDVEIRRNYFYKDLAWKGVKTWDVKNLMEFKLGERILVEGNIFKNHWMDAQNTFALVVTPRNENGNATWATVQDVTFRYNKVLNTKSGINISGLDTNPVTSVPLARVTLTHNFFEVNETDAGGDFRITQTINGPDYVEFIHNTFVTQDAGAYSLYMASASPKATFNTWRDNVMMGDVIGDGIGAGTVGLDGHNTDYSFTYNVMVGTAGTYTSPVANCQFPANATDVFTDYAGGDYTLKAAYQGDASDATDPGCNFTTLNSYTQNTEVGNWGSEPATYSDRSYTNAELPRTYVDTTYANQTGNVWTATNTSDSSVAGTGTGNRTGCSLSYALANCAIGDIIELTAGATYTRTTTATMRNI